VLTLNRGITQDSTVDWSIEAAKMGQYYSNSLFTISAVSASDGRYGIFSIRDSRPLSPCPVEILFPRSEEGGIGLEGTLTGFIHPVYAWDPSKDTYQYPAHRPPLWQRAWVMQERILPPRLLMFSDAQMSWKCRYEEASECVPEGNTTGLHSKEEKEIQAALLELKRYHSHIDRPAISGASSSNNIGENVWVGTSDERQRLYNSWYDLVTEYTKCRLTVASDIFPAISGIASTFERAIVGESFLAGLWKGDLHRGLLWPAVDSTRQMPDLRNYRAPSWSWASLRGPCVFTVRQTLLSDLDTSHLDITAVEIAADPMNPFGEVTFGSILAVGRLKKAHPAASNMEDREEIFRNLKAPLRSENLFDLEAGIPLGWYIADSQDRDNLTEVWCAPVFSVESPWSTEGDKKRDWYCLAMVELHGEGKCRAFMRVGMVWIKASYWFRGSEVEMFSIL
jgi:hypothetical protein